MRYLRLLPAGRPGLLVRADNHQRGEVELHYAPSTRFARDDEAAGRPRPTRLPFCVPVVERMVTRDRVTQTELALLLRGNRSAPPILAGRPLERAASGLDTGVGRLWE